MSTTTPPIIQRNAPASFLAITDLARVQERALEAVEGDSTKKDALIASTDFLKIKEVGEAFLTELVEAREKLFGAIPPVAAEKLVEHIFPTVWETKDEEERVKYEFVALVESTERVVNWMMSCADKADFSNTNNHLQLLHDYAYNAAILLMRGEWAINKQLINYGMRGANGINSWNTFRASQNALNGAVWGRLESQNTAAFLIRQALELLVTETVGLNSVYVNGIPVIANGFLFNTFLEDHVANGDIVFPLNFPTMKHILDWANLAVHQGWVPPIWQVEWVQNFLNPVFNSGIVNGKWSQNGSVQLKQAFVDDRLKLIEPYLRKKMNRPRIKEADVVEIELGQPKGNII